MEKQYTILVVDDSKSERSILEHFLTTLGYIPILAENGHDAMELFAAHSPDMVILDVVMPGVDGYEVARRIRERAGSTWIPILFLSGATKLDDEITGLAAGGDDYLFKPVNFPLLTAKIAVMQHIAEMQHSLREKTALLEHYQEETEHEQELAKHILNHLVRRDTFRKSNIQHWVVPAKQFSGDLLAATPTPNGTLHVILSDATGHGLAAALTGIPLIETFYNLSERGLPLAILAHELNRKIKTLMPTGRFVAATLAAIRHQDRLIEIWNGGNPDAVFIDETGRLIRSWPSTHPALGILDHTEFSGETAIFPWTIPGQLCLFSDGLIEAESPTGEIFGEERVRQILTESSMENRIGRLRASVTAHLDGRPAHDDISILAVNCKAKNPIAKH